MILDKIIDKTKADLEQEKARLTHAELEKICEKNAYKPKDVIGALKSTDDEPFRIIAEVKKASPSKGLIRENFMPVLIAKEYEKGGANAISVLTEPHFFLGDLSYLREIRASVKAPLLRKDFIIDDYQITQALANGADFILLIAKALSKMELKRLYDKAISIGLRVLVEAHDEDDIQKAVYANAKIIGINHRNLSTFDMDMKLCEKLIPMLPNECVKVAESGIYTHEQLVNLMGYGVDAFLVGEHFMRQDDVAGALSKLKNG
ncbi:indole-3-glycerol phosphate synthase TrpC [Campylobacter majalis]|uniref:indole-3-glycerol phosphate synthase TrpC n=1 Tax=Campylobacter majalis TaxID=2790656 RepID=UPI003D695269